MVTINVLPKDEYNQELVHNVHPADWQNPTPDGTYNLIVIGAGTGGLVSAAGAAGLGAKVALVERHLMGGDCLNVGCVPSKAVIRSARVLGDIQASAKLGVHIPKGVEVDFAAVMQRMRRVRAGISHHDSAERFRELGVDVFLGEGRFTGPKIIEVDGQTLHFKKAVIATGARATRPPIEGLAEAGFLTNESIFSLTERPRRLGVIGAGPIGSEMAQAFRRLGSEVILFDMAPHIMPREDKDAAKVVQDAFLRDGVKLVLTASIEGVAEQEGEKIIYYEQDGAQKSAVVDEILLSVGRTPNIESLDLESAGVAYHKGGVTVDDRLQTTNPYIYAVGDVAMKYQFTHAADAAARIALQNALFMGRKKVSALTIPRCTYTDPEVAHVGLTEHEAAAENIAIDTFTQSFKEVDRALTDGEEEGFVKIHIKKGTDKIVGATIVARHAGEMINVITLAMVTGLGLKTLSTVIHPYPTQSEAIKKIADVYNRTRLTPTIKNLFARWMSWMR